MRTDLFSQSQLPPSDERGRYQLVAGERRLRAHQLLERETIYAIETGGNPEVISLIENIQREQLDPLEEANAYAQMIERHGYSQAELGQIVGKEAKHDQRGPLAYSPLPLPSWSSIGRPIPSSRRMSLVEIAKEKGEGRQAELLGTALDGKLGVRAIRAGAPLPYLQDAKRYGGRCSEESSYPKVWPRRSSGPNRTLVQPTSPPGERGAREGSRVET